MAEVRVSMTEQERRRKISEARKGVPKSAEARRRMSEAQSKRSADHLRRMSEANRGKYRGQPVTEPRGDYVQLATQHGHALARGGRLQEHRKVLYDLIGPGPHPCHWRDVYSCGKDALEWGGRGGIFVDHLDGDTHNNSPENLVPSCNGCNIRRGNPESLTAQTVRNIRIMHAQGAKQREIGERFGISRPTVSAIVNRKTWKRVE